MPSDGFIQISQGSNNPNEIRIPKMFGAYIESISSSISYGAQGGTCQMSLVEDPENDITITLPEVGTACFIKYGKFEYGGIFQRWTYKEDISGRKYDVILESPGGKILNGVNAILSNFEGTAFNEGSGYDKFRPSTQNPNFTTQIKNVWNPYGHKENYSFGGRFGAANTNSAGFLAGELLDILELISRGESNFGGRIKYGQSEYIVDFGNLKNVPSFFRIAGQSGSLNSIISECAEVLQYDFFAEVKTNTAFLQLVKDLYGNDYTSGGGAIPNPVQNGLGIYIKTIDKTEQPNSGAVAALVQTAKNDGRHVSSDVGQELSDEVTQRVVVGGPASRYFAADINDCIPVWGKLGPKRYLLAPNFAPVPSGYNLNANVPIILDETAELSNNAGSLLSGTYTATVDELRMATAGFDSWIMFKVFQSVANGTYDQDPWVSSLDIDIFTLQKIKDGTRGANSLASTSVASAQKMYDKQNKEYSQLIFQKVKNVASEFYGRKFMVPLPVEPGGVSNNLKFIEEDIREEFSWAYSDSAWVSNKPISDIGFYDGIGRLKTASVYELSSSYDYSEMGSDYTGWKTFGPSQSFSDGIANTKCGPLDNGSIFFINGLSNPYIIMDTGVQIKEFDSTTTLDFGITYLAAKFFGIDVPPQNYIGPGKPNTQVIIPPKVAYPKLIGVPQQSNRYSWGPWYKYATDNGRSEVIFDQSLVPETFGSVGRMDQAAFDTAGAGVATISANESGRVELAEIPEWNIAERFNNSGPYVTNMSINIGIDGIITSYQFNTWTPNFGKLTKYNADRVSRIYKATLDALNRIRTDNPKIPLKSRDFKKTDPSKLASRLKQNRTSGGFTYFTTYNTPHSEAEICNLSDAAALTIEKSAQSFGCSIDQQWTMAGSRLDKSIESDGLYIKSPSDLEDEKDGIFTIGVCPSSRDLDPYFSEMVYGDAGTMIENSEFHSVVNDSNGVTLDFQVRKANELSRIDHVRSLGLRGPVLLSGWGFDVANNPVPNNGDIAEFSSDGVTDRSQWKTGPVNLMWDDERKIWSGGLEILSGILDTAITAPSSPLSPTTFDVRLLRKTSEDKGEGALEESGETVTCYNRDPSLSQASGDNVFCMIIRINYEWTPLWIGCP